MDRLRIGRGQCVEQYGASEAYLHYWDAELQRLKGTLKRISNEEGAEACFLDALEIARRQEAKFLELRAAMSLARPWQQEGQTVKARNLLAPVFEWFTEGFDTPDLAEAKVLFAELDAGKKSGSNTRDKPTRRSRR